MSDPLREAAAQAVAALAPFAGCETNDDGEPRRDSEWPPMTERVKDWFGWEDFRAAIAALDALREALVAEPAHEYRALVGSWASPIAGSRLGAMMHAVDYCGARNAPDAAFERRWSRSDHGEWERVS